MVILGFFFNGFYLIESTDRCEHWYRAQSLSSVPWESYDVIDGLTPGKCRDSVIVDDKMGIHCHHPR